MAAIVAVDAAAVRVTRVPVFRSMACAAAQLSRQEVFRSIVQARCAAGTVRAARPERPAAPLRRIAACGRAVKGLRGVAHLAIGMAVDDVSKPRRPGCDSAERRRRWFLVASSCSTSRRRTEGFSRTLERTPSPRFSSLRLRRSCAGFGSGRRAPRPAPRSRGRTRTSTTRSSRTKRARSRRRRTRTALPPTSRAALRSGESKTPTA